MIFIVNIIFERIARSFPKLKSSLRKAGMEDKPNVFVKKTVITALYMTFGLVIFLFLVFARQAPLVKVIFLSAPVLFIFMFFYMLKFPEAKISKKEKEISKEIVFAGRYLIIELESGIPLYNALVNLSRNYPIIGKYFKEIIDKVNLGTSMEDALNESIELSPSDNFRRILWQILNSLRTGSDISTSLNSVLEQIVKEQKIEVSKYGRKLNPLAMFYMIISVILPSLGITMLIILSSFIEFELNLTMLIFISFMLGFMQFMFLSIIKFSRPPIDM